MRFIPANIRHIFIIFARYMTRRILILIATAATVLSCRMAGSVGDTAGDLFRGETVARVGEHRLRRGELDRMIPSGVSAQDSSDLAQRYIKAWAEDLLMLDMANAQLSKSEKDVTRELEDYRRSLLKFRYQQLYINQRLDTLVTDAEIRRYYEENQDKFRLERPILKARYLIIPSDSRALPILRKKMASEDDEDLIEADSLAFTTAIKYADSSDIWMDAISLAQEMGTDFRSLSAAIRDRRAEITDEAGITHFAYIADMVPAGRTAPVEYCSERIRDMILSGRKHALLKSLEQDLLEDARRNNKFIIY